MQSQLGDSQVMVLSFCRGAEVRVAVELISGGGAEGSGADELNCRSASMVQRSFSASPPIAVPSEELS